MARTRKAKKTSASTQSAAPATREFPGKAVVAVTAALFFGLGFAAYAGNAVLHGHVFIIKHGSSTPSKAGISAPAETAKKTEAPARNQPASSAALVDKYGDAASSAAVAAAIRDIQAKSPSKRAVAAADRYEALLHGRPMPGTDPTALLMAGYVPPGMDPYTASMLSRSLPKLPRMPRTGQLTPEEIDQMAGMPADPQDATLASCGTSRAQIDAANQAQFERYMREEHGPVYMPPLHADHTWLAEHATKTAKGFVVTKDYDGSIREMTDSSGNVVSEITYDPWGVPTQIAGSGPMPDKLFQGMYYHQRSGKYLTLNRVYDPILGRFISRDPLGEIAGTNLYAFAGNDPINHSDPLGLDYWLLHDTSALGSSASSGIGPFGHTGNLVGNPTTGYDYFSSSHDPNFQIYQHFNTLQDIQNSGLMNRYPEAAYIPTTPEQDAAMSAYGSQNYQRFNIATNNCSNLSKGITSAGGLGPFRSGFPSRPNALFNSVSNWALNHGGAIVNPSTGLMP